MDCKISRSNSGMSLLEVVIAVGLMGLVMSMTFTTLRSLVAARTNVKDMAMYQKYIDSINNKVVNAFKAIYFDADRGKIMLPSTESDMSAWKTALNNASGELTDKNIGFRIRRFVYNAADNPPRMQCDKCSNASRLIWRSNTAGAGCPTNMLDNGNIARGIYEFCVKIDPRETDPARIRALFPTQDLLRQNPVIRYIFSIRTSNNLKAINLTSVNVSNETLNGNRSMLVIYTMNWHNDETTYSSKCKYTQGMFYTALQ